MSSPRWIALGLLLFAAACGNHHDPHVTPRRLPRPVSIEVELYDPVTNFVWENVGVRIVEAEQEWSGCICQNPDPDAFFLSDQYGLVYFDEFALADAEVGFVVDGGRAMLQPDAFADEAVVLLEAWAPGFDSVFFEVALSWREPDVFVSVPFE